jgi:hypothetical protein
MSLLYNDSFEIPKYKIEPIEEKVTKISPNFLFEEGKLKKIESKSLITKYSGPLLPEGTMISYNNCSSYCNELILKEISQIRMDHSRLTKLEVLNKNFSKKRFEKKKTIEETKLW